MSERRQRLAGGRGPGIRRTDSVEFSAHWGHMRPSLEMMTESFPVFDDGMCFV